jgi:hypothetical protein
VDLKEALLLYARSQVHQAREAANAFESSLEVSLSNVKLCLKQQNSWYGF